MKVREITGNGKPGYKLYVEGGAPLNDHAQQVYDKLKPITHDKVRDRTTATDAESTEIKQKIQAQGYYIVKTVVNITESVVPVKP